MALGASVAVRGVLTTPFGLLDGGRHAYLDDGTGAIVVVTDFDAPLLPVGTDFQAFGVLEVVPASSSLEIAQPSDAIVLARRLFRSPSPSRRLSRVSRSRPV